MLLVSGWEFDGFHWGLEDEALLCSGMTTLRSSVLGLCARVSSVLPGCEQTVLWTGNEELYEVPKWSFLKLTANGWASAKRRIA